MKKFIFSTGFAALMATQGLASVVFIDLADVAIPTSVQGLYVNVLTGATQTFEPLTFNTAPWINLYSGGVGIANSDVLRPWASQPAATYDPEAPGNYFLNLTPGTLIDGSGQFVSGESASALHVGGGSDQFQLGVPGFLAFEYDLAGGGVAYGWLSFAPNAGTEGFSYDLAYSTLPGESLAAGVIPEPSSYSALAGSIGLFVVACARRRRAV